jgi:hypothetical protein
MFEKMVQFGRQISFLLQDIRRYAVDLIYFTNAFNSINIYKICVFFITYLYCDLLNYGTM